MFINGLSIANILILTSEKSKKIMHFIGSCVFITEDATPMRGTPMLSERPERRLPRIRGRATQRVWDGLVRGLPDCWVVVPRDDADLIDWLESELCAVDEATGRIRN